MPGEVDKTVQPESIELLQKKKVDLPSQVFQPMAQEDLEVYIGILKAFHDVKKTDEFKKVNEAFVESLKNLAITTIKQAVLRMNESQKKIVQKISKELTNVVNHIEKVIFEVTKNGITTEERKRLLDKVQFEIMGELFGLMQHVQPFSKAQNDPSLKISDEEIKESILYLKKNLLEIVRGMIAATL